MEEAKEGTTIQPESQACVESLEYPVEDSFLGQWEVTKEWMRLAGWTDMG